MNVNHQQKIGVLILLPDGYCEQILAGATATVWIAETAHELGYERVIVASHGVSKSKPENVEILKVEKDEGLHNVLGAAKNQLQDCERIIVIDRLMPLLTEKTLERLVNSTGPVAATFFDDKDELSRGPFSFDADWLYERRSGFRSSSDLVNMFIEEGGVLSRVVASEKELICVEDAYSVVEAEGGLRGRLVEKAIGRGVSFTDLGSVVLEHDVKLEGGVRIEPNCQMYGNCLVRSGSIIGPGTVLKDSIVGEESTVIQSVISDSQIGSHVRVGPFSHVRENTKIGDYCEIGTSAEVKASELKRFVKMHHFSYLGDATVGESSNIGAGAITCNFDGQEKHRTEIGASAFIGSSTMLVAPVVVGDDAMTGAGSVVLDDVPAKGKVVGVPAQILKKSERKNS